MPLHCVVDELGAEPPLDVAAETTVCPYESSKTTRTSKRQPSLRSASCALGDVRGQHCSERLPTCSQCLCRLQPILLQLHGLPDSRNHPHEESRTSVDSELPATRHINGTFTLDHCWRRNLGGASAPCSPLDKLSVSDMSTAVPDPSVSHERWCLL